MQGRLLAERYRLVDTIGSGGMGRVWRAHDEVLHRAVAIKELTAALYVSENEQAILLRRTRAEARAAARINHSAVVTVHDVLEHDNRPWIVMELVEGVSLADAVRDRGRVEAREAARIGMWVLRALRAAHRAGVLHRDVKPGNVLIAEDGRVMLTDFGIAQVEGDTTITRTGEIVGSVDYIAPERVRGQEPGPASDLWSLGATLYTAVEGKSPFRRTTPLTTMQAVVSEEAAEPVAAGPLGPVITALLCKDPAVRPGPDEAEQMLAEAAEGRRPREAQAFVATQRRAGGGEGPEGSGGAGVAGVDGGVGGVGVAGGPGGPVGPGGSGASAGAGASDGSGGGAHGAAPGTAGGSGAWGSGRSTVGAASGGGGHAGGVFDGGSGTPVAPVPGGWQQPAAGPAAAAGPVGGPVARGGKRRGWGRRAAVVLLLAALVGGGGAVALHYADGWSTGSGSSGGEDGAGGGDQAADGVPEGWERVEDPEGFSLALPKGWKRQVKGSQIDYTPDGGEHFLRIAVDDSPDFDSPYHHQLDLEEQVRTRADYRKVSLKENVYRDRPGALWDFTWTAREQDSDFPGPRRAIEQMYLSRDGVEYTIYISSPVADWKTAETQFYAVLRSWRAPQT
ncbi:serine/threonine-protein kinase [Streptomyces griseiscabiei]|uniref:non-specific serine/threonine protein kinase n=1 Tax=Streptomyces griseiscabiei TaxID=2993540 RepID=A0ABU4LCQ1_9ACTN|nr:serine/threonine-protein kinase [Streptomyces griseiscabiei]MBZ3907458.1 serine/threonine protein kinase [Streptomyces griseiscabiei]MDX2913551.1 serine/threonine protein kinase [Streptomyces griseiscabiei]